MTFIYNKNKYYKIGDDIMEEKEKLEWERFLERLNEDNDLSGLEEYIKSADLTTETKNRLATQLYKLRM